jgi:solute carrier family 25 (mitochondrial 2-oxodicarboxylate transporter), member 21
MKFTCNEIYKPIFTNKQNGAISFAGSGMAGAMAGATETFINCPFEVVKVRMQSKDNLKLYKNTMDAVVQIGTKEGISTLYKGFEAQLLRNAMWNGTYFALIPAIHKMAGHSDSKTEELTKKFISGAVAGTVATTTNTPFDVVKSRIQNQIGSANPKYVWSIPSIGTVFKEEGLRALYKGYAARLYRLGPGGGIMIVAFDQISEWLKKYGF